MSRMLTLDSASWRKFRERLDKMGADGMLEAVAPLVKEGMAAIREKARANIDAQKAIITGLLKRAVRAGNFRKRKDKSVSGAVGINRNVVGTDPDDPTEKRWPIKYGHLVEWGHNSRFGPVAPKPFMRPAWNEIARPLFERMKATVKARLRL